MFGAVSGFRILILLVGLGFPLMRRRLWEGRRRFLPLALGPGFIPAVAAGIILEAAFGERYLEIPLMVMGGGRLGAAWVSPSAGGVRIS